MAEIPRPNDGTNQFFQYLTDSVRRVDASVSSTQKRKVRVPPAERFGLIALLRGRPTPRDITSYVDRFYPLSVIEQIEQPADSSSIDQIVMRYYLQAIGTSGLLNGIKVETIGVSAPTGVINMVSSQVVERMAWWVGTKYAADLQENPQIAAGLAKFSDHLFNPEHGRLQWYAAKTAIFSESLWSAVNVQHEMDLRGSELENEAELKKSNDTLFDRTQELRSYGIKSAIVPALGAGQIQEWLVVDPLHEAEGGQELYRDRYRFGLRPIARFLGTSGSFTSSRIDYGERRMKKGAAKLQFASLEDSLADDSELNAVVCLSEEGELVTSLGLPIKKLLSQRQADSLEYETLRAEILSLYADLVTPAFIAEAVHAHQQRLQDGPGQGRLGRDRKPSLRSLVLARIKIIEDQSARIKDALEQGEDAVSIESFHPERSTRHIANHEVVGHLRKLAPHQRATPRARELAWEEARIELPERGVTWVVKHMRGTEPDESLGHKVTLRKGSAARVPGRKREQNE